MIAKEGTGIGLVICRNLVELMGGTIDFDSKEGEGTTFWFDLPYVVADPNGDNEDFPDEEETGKLSGQPSDASSADENVVLYIEDNPANLKLMQKIVSRIGDVTMISAHNAELGIELAIARQPDLIILDINLPGMSGIDAIRKLKSEDTVNKIPVIAMSAAATKADINKGMAAGFEKYLTKPIQVSEVTSTIKELVASPE